MTSEEQARLLAAFERLADTTAKQSEAMAAIASTLSALAELVDDHGRLLVRIADHMAQQAVAAIPSDEVMQ